MFRRRQNRKRRSLKERLQGWFESICAFGRRVGPYLVLAAVAVAIPYLVFLGYHEVVSSPYFQVSEIEIRGAKHADIDRLAGEAKLAHGINIFDVDPAATGQLFETSPWVREARVDRQLPDRVVVDLTERRPSALLVDDGFSVLGQDGRPIKTFEDRTPRPFLDLPMITGIGLDEIGEAERGGQLVREAIRVADIYDEMKLDREKPLSEIHVNPVLGLTLMTEGSATEIRLGRGRYRRRLERLETLRRSLAERDIEPAYILLDQEESLDRVTVGRRSSSRASRASQGMATSDVD